MPDSNKAEWIATLRNQLNQAEDRQQRWRHLGSQLRRTSREVWERIAYLRQLEVESLKTLLDEAQARQD